MKINGDLRKLPKVLFNLCVNDVVLLKIINGRPITQWHKHFVVGSRLKFSKLIFCPVFYFINYKFCRSRAVSVVLFVFNVSN